jgi:hypothetical protein
MQLEEIISIQEKSRLKFSFPWLRIGVLTLGVSCSFLAIALIEKVMNEDMELFHGFLITFVIGAFTGVSMIINHFVGNRRNN